MSSGNSDGELLREQIEAIQAATLDGVFTVDRAGRLLSANARATEIFGLSEEELLGRDVLALMPPTHANAELAYRELHGTTVIARAVNQTIDVTGRRADGDAFPFRLSVRRVGQGARTYYLCLVHDLTGVRHSAAKILALSEQVRERSDTLERTVDERTAQLSRTVDDLARANAQLEREIRERESIALALQKREVQLERLLTKERELNELRSRFVSMASHEFRTPLTTMLSSVEVIDMAVEQPPALLSKHTRRIRESIGYLRNVLEDFLQLGKLDVKGTDLHLTEVDVPQLSTGLVEDLSLMCKPGQDIELTLEGDLAPVPHSANALRIILTNLVTNAIKYSEAGSAIDVAIARAGDRLRVRVRDEGIGIPTAELPYLFERFFRATNAETVKGTGLGLHIVSRYVTAARGTIEADSVPGEGTTITVELPYPLDAAQLVA